MMVINNIFSTGDIVYLKTDKDQMERIITAIIIYGSGNINYRVAAGTQETWHSEIEITTEKNVLITTTN